MGLSSENNTPENNKLSRPVWNHDDLSMASWLDGMLHTGWLASPDTRVSRHDVHTRDGVNL